MDGVLSLRGFVEACRRLSASSGVLTTELATSIQGDTAEGPHASPIHPAAALENVEARRVLLAGMYLEFDQDASGGVRNVIVACFSSRMCFPSPDATNAQVDRDEFRDNLWIMTRATEEERVKQSSSPCCAACSCRVSPLYLDLLPWLRDFGLHWL